MKISKQNSHREIVDGKGVPRKRTSVGSGKNVSTDKSKGSKSSSPLREGKNSSRNGKVINQSNTKDPKKVATLIDTQESKKAAEMIRMIDLVEAKVNNFD